MTNLILALTSIWTLLFIFETRKLPLKREEKSRKAQHVTVRYEPTKPFIGKAKRQYPMPTDPYNIPPPPPPPFFGPSPPFPPPMPFIYPQPMPLPTPLEIGKEVVQDIVTGEILAGKQLNSGAFGGPGTRPRFGRRPSRWHPNYASQYWNPEFRYPYSSSVSPSTMSLVIPLTPVNSGLQTNLMMQQYPMTSNAASGFGSQNQMTSENPMTSNLNPSMDMNSLMPGFNQMNQVIPVVVMSPGFIGSGFLDPSMAIMSGGTVWI